MSQVTSKLIVFADLVWLNMKLQKFSACIDLRGFVVLVVIQVPRSSGDMEAVCCKQQLV